MVKFWKTLDGRRLKICEMDIDHLRNAAAMLRRNGGCSIADLNSAFYSLQCCQGDMATYYAEQALSNLRPSGTLDALEEEIAKRDRTG